jgi:hypothetical protein
MTRAVLLAFPSRQNTASHCQEVPIRLEVREGDQTFRFLRSLMGKLSHRSVLISLGFGGDIFARFILERIFRAEFVGPEEVRALVFWTILATNVDTNIIVHS